MSLGLQVEMLSGQSDVAGTKSKGRCGLTVGLHLGIVGKNLMSSVVCGLVSDRCRVGHRVAGQLAVGGIRERRGSAGREASGRCAE